MAGPISNMGKGLKVTTEEEAHKAIDRYADAGYPQIKIHASNYPPAFATCGSSSRMGLPTRSRRRATLLPAARFRRRIA
jgi:hypothetical protein